VREFRSHGSERGAASNDRPYRTSLRVLSVMTDAVEKVVDLSDFLPEGRSGSINRRPRRHLEKGRRRARPTQQLYILFRSVDRAGAVPLF
jgi:hypothetical protein